MRLRIPYFLKTRDKSYSSARTRGISSVALLSIARHTICREDYRLMIGVYASYSIGLTLMILLVGAIACSLNFTSAYAAETYSLVRQWGSFGAGEGQFHFPYSLALDSSNHVYVSDLNNQRIEKFDTNGNFITMWSTGPFNHATDIATDSFGNVYINHVYNEIIKYTSDGTFIKSWAVNANPNPKDNDVFPAIAIDSSNNVYASNNNTIFKFTNDGTFIKSWGSGGKGDGQFNQIVGIATDSSNNVYVTDSGNGRIEKFTSDGTFIKSWGANCQTEKVFCAGIVLIAIDSSNNVYVTSGQSDPSFFSVAKFTSDGDLVTGWDAPAPHGVAVDRSGNVYISSGFDNIQVYAPTSVNPPHTTINSAVDGNGAGIQSGGTTFSTSIKFTFTATTGTNPIAGLECSLDNSGFSSCSSPVTLTNLAVGMHTFQVRAVDTSGNRDPTPASFSWKIAAIYPPSHTTITAIDGNVAGIPDGGTTTSSSITFTLAAVAGTYPIAGFQCSLDNSQFSSCTSPVTLHNLVAGSHRFTAVAVDTVGNRDSNAASFGWTILTPTQTIQQLTQNIQSMGLNQGTQISLIAPLNAALFQLGSNHQNSAGTACNQLNAFTNHVNADGRNGQLSSIQAAQLIQSAQNIQKSLGCTGNGH